MTPHRILLIGYICLIISIILLVCWRIWRSDSAKAEGFEGFDLNAGGQTWANNAECIHGPTGYRFGTELLIRNPNDLDGRSCIANHTMLGMVKDPDTCALTGDVSGWTNLLSPAACAADPSCSTAVDGAVTLGDPTPWGSPSCVVTFKPNVATSDLSAFEKRLKENAGSLVAAGVIDDLNDKLQLQALSYSTLQGNFADYQASASNQLVSAKLDWQGQLDACHSDSSSQLKIANTATADYKSKYEVCKNTPPPACPPPTAPTPRAEIDDSPDSQLTIYPQDNFGGTPWVARGSPTDGKTPFGAAFVQTPIKLIAGGGGSVKVPDGQLFIAYDAPNLTGKPWLVHGPSRNRSVSADSQWPSTSTIMSFAIMTESSVTAFTEPNYGGKKATFMAGAGVDIHLLNASGIGNDNLSSILIPPTMKVRAWEDNFGGYIVDFNGTHQPDLRKVTTDIAGNQVGSWDNRITSFGVHKIDDPW